MRVSLRFRCQYCDEQPDPLTQISLVTAMRQASFGEYQDALPGRWLIFHGRGLFGPRTTKGAASTAPFAST